MNKSSQLDRQKRMNVEKLLRVVVMLIVALWSRNLFAPAARAQAGEPPFEVGDDYNYVRANGPPGGCGCFSMNGGNIWASVRLAHGFSAVGEFSGQYSNDVNATGADLTLYSYVFGPRYTLGSSRRWRPFAQLLVGGAHASGAFEPAASGASGSSNAFAMVAGGGLDADVTSHFALRLFEADYYLTLFPNGVNGHQNNLRISAGIILRF